MSFRHAHIALVLSVVVGHSAAGAAPEAAVAQPGVVVGVGQAAFDLPPKVPLAGYSKRHGKPSQGLHDPVGARALVLRDAHTTFVLVSCDLLIIDETLYAEAVRALQEAGLPRESAVIVSATHTHSGPGAYGRKFAEKISMGHFDPRVREAILSAVVTSVERALAGMDQARMAVTVISVPGVVKNRVDERGQIDQELAAVAWYHPGRAEPVALLLSFAAHPTTLGAWNWELSADYPGVLRQRIEAALPGTTAIFVAGAVGDQAPVKSGDGFERAAWVGARLAEAALTAVSTLHPEPVQRVSVREQRLMLDRARVRLGRRVALPRWLSRRLVDDDATLTAARIDGVAFFGLPCDYAAELGATLKQAAHAQGATPVLIGFANDYIGYCLSETVYRTARYEALMAFNGPRTGERVTETLIAMIEPLTHAAR